MDKIRELKWFAPPVGSDEEAIRNVEQHIGITFPQEYHEFLAANGGGAPIETDFTIDEPRGSFNASVGVFLTAGDDSYGILPTLALVKPRGITDLVPIAESGGGDFVCLDYRNGPVPVIAYWHHGRYGLDEEVVVLTGSFAKFLELLREPSDN